MGELWGQLKHSREAWALVQPRFSMETGQVETDDQRNHRVMAYTKARSKATTSRSRRQRVILSFSPLFIIG